MVYVAVSQNWGEPHHKLQNTLIPVLGRPAKMVSLILRPHIGDLTFRSSQGSGFRGFRYGAFGLRLREVRFEADRGV